MSTVTRVEAPIVEDPEWTSLFEPDTDRLEEVTAMLGRQPVFDNLTNRQHETRGFGSRSVIPAAPFSVRASVAWSWR